MVYLEGAKVSRDFNISARRNDCTLNTRVLENKTWVSQAGGTTNNWPVSKQVSR